MAGRNLFADQPVAAKPAQGRNLFAQPQEVPRETQPEQPTQGMLDNLRQAILDAPLGSELAEFGAAVNRGTASLVDFFVTKPVEAGLQLAGVDAQLPRLAETSPAVGGFIEPGLTKDILRSSGELVAPGAALGGAFRTASKAIPAIQAGAQTLGQGVTRQLGASTAAQDVGFSALSGVGAEVGQETGIPGGELIGAFAAPVIGASVKPALSGLLKAGKSGIQAITKPFAGVSDDGAATLLAEAMVREGLTPNDITKRLAELGPEAIPADLGNNFARLLRVASNKIPRIEGSAADVFKARQSGQGDRLLSSLDDATGTSSLTLDDEIARITTVLKPKINQLYKEAGETALEISPKLQNLLTGKSSLGKAAVKAQQRLIDRQVAGDNIRGIDIIDATKQELDDQIGKFVRKGAMNKVRDLVRVKNVMVDEADATVPVYKEARDLFAGKASLENAAEIGKQFIKLKPRDMRFLTKTFGESERRMFKLGAKQSILDKIDDLQTNADAVKRLFGKNGDVKKLRFLFDDEKQFTQFSKTLGREADFILTRRAAQANSTTTKQLSDETSAVEVLGNVANAISSPLGATSTVNRILSGLGKGKNDADFLRALEQTGDILLVKGIEPARIQSLLKRGQSKQIEIMLKRALKRPNKAGFAAASLAGGGSTLDQTGQQQQ